MKTVQQLDLQLTAGNNKGTRRELDFYPTPQNVTVALMDFLNMPTAYTIWEPACGNGAMSIVMEQMGYTCFSTDINHACYGDGGMDYLTTSSINADAIITNPPPLILQRTLSGNLSGKHAT